MAKAKEERENAINETLSRDTVALAEFLKKVEKKTKDLWMQLMKERRL